MPHPTKKRRLDESDNNQRDEVVVVTDSDDFVVSFDDLSDVLPNILEFLTLKDIMCKRRINKRTKEAVKMTIVPLTGFWVDCLERYNRMVVMTRAMPNLQHIILRGLGIGRKYSDGEDPDEHQAARYTNQTSYDIGIISNFSKLKILDIYGSGLNGRYPFLFNSFPLLEKLRIQYCSYLKWDLEMLAGFPLLKELYCEHNSSLTGSNISSLRVLKDTLENVTIKSCFGVEGNFMDLADFPHLKELNLHGTAVIGDIRDIGENDFPSLEDLMLPKGVYGGHGHELQRISDAPDLAAAVYLLKKQHPTLKMSKRWRWHGVLSEDSPDSYVSVDGDTPPIYINFVQAGPRIGYRWGTGDAVDTPCEVNWLDPEPDRESIGYEKYIEELQEINSQVNFYRGFHQPPTEEEYHRLWEEYEEYNG